MTEFDRIIAQIAKLVGAAPDDELEKLGDMLVQYSEKYSRSWDGIRKQPAMRKLLDAVCAESNMMPVASDLKI